MKKELKSLVLTSALGALVLSLSPLVAMGKSHTDDILRPVKFAENEEGIIPKFKHKT